MICARRTSPAPSFCERVIRASLCASSSRNARTRRVIATSPARTGTPCNAPDPEKSHPTYRMHHLGRSSLDQGIESLRKQREIGRRRETVVAVLDQRNGGIAAREPFGKAQAEPPRHGLVAHAMQQPYRPIDRDRL